MVQDGLTHHDVERPGRLQQFDRRTDELGPPVHRVMRCSNLRRFDGPVGDVDPCHKRAAQREQDRVPTVTTAEVENALAFDIA